MKIQQSQVQLAGQHEAARNQSMLKRQSVEIRPATVTPTKSPVDLSAQALATQQAEANNLDLRQQLESHPLWMLIKQLIKGLTGRDVDISEIVPGQPTHASQPSAASPSIQTTATDWRVEYHARQTLHESEHTQFNATGQVSTEDGRTIEFSAALALSREYRQEIDVQLTAASAGLKKDPLVLNFAAPSAQLVSGKIDFDLDADGQTERVSFVAAGSGFLALDKNDDGAINNGSELFGTRSGNGFADLAQYDGDHNSWIDESDMIWGQLKLWTIDESGNNQLVDLKSLNIGAIYLGNTRTDFSLRDANNQEHGQIRRTGVYLTESGQVGTVQQVDLNI